MQNFEFADLAHFLVLTPTYLKVNCNSFSNWAWDYHLSIFQASIGDFAFLIQEVYLLPIYYFNIDYTAFNFSIQYI